MSQSNKMELQEEGKDLKLFFYTAQIAMEGVLVDSITAPEEFKMVMTYSDANAMNTIRKDYPVGVPISLRKRGEVEVRRLLGSVNLRGIAETRAIKIDVPERTAEQFAHGLMLVADKFVTNARDRKSLERIINKIKV